MAGPWHSVHTPSVKDIAAAAVARQGEYGAVTELSRLTGVRRQTIHDVRTRANRALEKEFAAPVRRPRGSFSMEVTDEHVERVIIALRVQLPGSIRDIVEALHTIYGVHWSYGTVWDVLHRADRMAAARLASTDLSRIKHIAIDEMFSQGRPVLASIDLDSQYLFQLEVRANRSGETWAKSLSKVRDEQRLNPESAVKDAGTGLGAGVRACWPTVKEADDLFHAVYKMGKEAYHLERSAYRAIGIVDDIVDKVARAPRPEVLQALAEQLKPAREHMDAAIHRFDRFEELRREATRVLDLTDRGSGKLRTSAEVLSALTRVAADMDALGGKRVRSVAKYIGNRAAGLGLYLDDLGVRLAQAAVTTGSAEAVAAAIRACQASISIARGGPAWDRRARQQEMVDATRHLVAATGSEPARLKLVLGTVIPEIVQRHRASSAIENLNSVLRPYLVVQKHAEQGFLNLFRFFWNTRKRAWGRWKGTSAHEMVTGDKVVDWLTALGFPTGRPASAKA